MKYNIYNIYDKRFSKELIPEALLTKAMSIIYHINIKKCKYFSEEIIKLEQENYNDSQISYIVINSIYDILNNDRKIINEYNKNYSNIKFFIDILYILREKSEKILVDTFFENFEKDEKNVEKYINDKYYNFLKLNWERPALKEKMIQHSLKYRKI